MKDSKKFDEKCSEHLAEQIPDRDLAWEKMDTLLNNNKRRRTILFPVFIIAGLFVMLLSVLFFSNRRHNNFFYNNDTISFSATSSEQKKGYKAKSSQRNNNAATGDVSAENEYLLQRGTALVERRERLQRNAQISYEQKEKLPALSTKKSVNENNRNKLREHRNLFVSTNKKSHNHKSYVNAKKFNETDFASRKNKKRTKGVANITIGSGLAEEQSTNIVTDFVTGESKDGNSSVDHQSHGNKETVTAGDKVFSVDSVHKIVKEHQTLDSLTTTVQVKGQSKQRGRWKFSGGIGIQQHVAINGQSLFPGNYRGTSSRVMDYVPYFYFRLTARDKWFIETAYMHSVPQPVKEQVYSQVKERASFPALSTTTKLMLKKTYFNQLPVTVNYYVKPNLAVGGGVIYNRLFSTISERQVVYSNNAGFDTTVTQTVIKGADKVDSVFSKSSWSYVVQAEWKWRRLGVGARYIQGFRPFLKYNMDGSEYRSRIKSLQLYIRYQLWASKKIGK